MSKKEPQQASNCEFFINHIHLEHGLLKSHPFFTSCKLNEVQNFTMQKLFSTE